jgi:hypothetical protein
MNDKYKPKTKTQKWGLAIFAFSMLGVFAGLATGDVAIAVVFLVVYGLPAALGFYLWTSKAPSKYFGKRNLEKQRQADGAIQAALAPLNDLSGVKAVLAYEHLESLVRKAYKKDAGPKLNDLLQSIGFDRSNVESKFLGTVDGRALAPFLGFISSDKVRVYKDWVIAGKIGYDFDVSTRGEVTVDGSIAYDKNNKPVDNRTASLHLATQDWSHSFSIDPNQANQARSILNQLNAIVEQLKPKAVSAADIADLMERLVNSTGQSPAEKLEELSNLRYQRLLSDKEFESAKQKILGI